MQQVLHMLQSSKFFHDFYYVCLLSSERERHIQSKGMAQNNSKMMYNENKNMEILLHSTKFNQVKYESKLVKQYKSKIFSKISAVCLLLLNMLQNNIPKQTRFPAPECVLCPVNTYVLWILFLKYLPCKSCSVDCGCLLLNVTLDL